MPNRKNSLVLIVDDHPVNRKVLSLLLESLKVPFDLASNGVEAVEAATKYNYGIVLMDCMMPEMDGFEAAFQIRKFEFERNRHTPIIAVTALDKDRIVQQCIRSGMDDYLGKPFTRELLEQKIAYWSVIPLALGPITPKVAAHIQRLEASDQAEKPIDRSYLNVMYGIQQLDDVLSVFLSVTVTLLFELETAIQHHDVMVVRRMAHEIKSSSYSVSAREMSQVCLDLERASEEQDWPEIEKLYVALGLAFARVRECLENKAALFQSFSKAS